MTEVLFADVDAYIDGLFAPNDPVLAGALAASEEAGLPPIHVSAGQGKLLYLLARLIGARRILEIGTLAGYSTIWLGRALPADGMLVSLELDSKHAEVATANLSRAGLSDKTRIIVGPACNSLSRLEEEGGGLFDLIFIDADKVSYPSYLEWALRLTRSGGLILGDNVVRSGAVLDAESDDPNVQGARAFNAAIAAHPNLEAIVLQQVGCKGHDGLAIARVRSA